MNVKNKAIIRKLTLRSLRAGKMRNIIAVCAIALTAVLFTSVFTLGGSAMSAIEEQTKRQVGTQAHGGLKYLTAVQYDNFKQSPLLKDISYNILLSIAENEALKKEQCEIRYGEDKIARWGFSYPEVGNMPRANHEIACSTIVLDALGVPREIGASVPLVFSVGGRQYSEQFTLCGYWQGDAVAGAQQIWLSEHYVRSVLSENDISQDNYAGTISADLWFSSALDIEGKMQRLIAERGYDVNEIEYGANWAYAASDIDPTMIAITVFVLALILLSGYLIIYSIFAISVNTDIRFYGLLKTIGTTGKQIRSLVRGQALILSAIGIPIGLIIGSFAGLILAPLASNILSYEISGSTKINPLVFLFSALFSLFTVFVSCRKPARIAAKVPSVEAAKYSSAPVRTRKSKVTRNITALSFAWANITREKKKLCTVVLSLSLSLILLNSAFSAAGSFDLDEYVRHSVVSDFALADSKLYMLSTGEVGEGVSASVSKDIAAQPGISNMENIYFREEGGLPVPPENKGNFEELKTALIEADPQHAPYYKEYENTFDLQIYGIGKQLAAQIGVDYDKLGDGVYAAYFDLSGERMGIHNVGDTIHLKTDSGASDVAVVGLFQNEDYPYAASARYSSLIGDILLMEDTQFRRIYGKVQPMQVNINVTADRIEDFEIWLSDYIERNAPALSFVSRNKLKGEFEGMQRTYLGIGGALSLVLALIGILNFVNAMVTSIFARRREFAMLQSLGMTGRQLKRTLFFEGGGYTLLTAAFTMTIGFGLTYLITWLIAGQVWFFQQNLTMLPAIICLPILLALCLAVPVICHAKLSRESVVERLRVE